MGAEVENGRIVRLMTKLGFINERAEYVNFPFPPTPPRHYSCFVETNCPWIRFELDPRWSDTGDRYILKLFRDYVFHSVGVDGKPILDLSHVLVCLNKVRLDVLCSSNNSLVFTSCDLNSGGERKKHIDFFKSQLDAGLDERVMLVSRDDQSCLVVSYREIKHCIEAAFK